MTRAARARHTAAMTPAPHQSPAELYRLLANLVRIGTVFALDTDKAKLRIKDGAGFESGWISWGTERAGDDKNWQPYSLGEQLVIICPCGDPAQAIVLCALYSSANPAPSSNANSTEKYTADGASFVHNKDTGVLTINLPGKIVINANIELIGNITQTGEHTSTGDQIAGSISQINHLHKEQGDGADVSKPK